MGRADIDTIAADLAAMTSAQRATLPAMPRGREDVILAGVVILQGVLARFSCERVFVSESDILDGAAMDIARR